MNFYTHVAQWGNNIFVRGVRDGERFNTKIKYKPTLYVPSKKPSKFTTLEGSPVSPIRFETIKEAKEFVAQYENQPNLVYGLNQFIYTYIAENYQDIRFDRSLMQVYTLDIEVQCENGFPNQDLAVEELLSITVKQYGFDEITVWGIGYYYNDNDNVNYIRCQDEQDLLLRFLGWWDTVQPDAITGWNTEFFDIPYICNRIKRVLGDKLLKDLSPWKIVNERKINGKFGKTTTVFEIMGVSNLDYQQLYQKFTYSNQESYKLDHIAFVELGERKDENPYETFREWYTKDYQSFIDYNIQDVLLVERLDAKMKLMDLLMTMAYEAKVNFADAFTSVRYWDILIYNFLRTKNIVIPQKDSSTKTGKFSGAYVKDPAVGQHKWVLSFDLNSLYPHLIIQYNISPETIVDDGVNFGDTKIGQFVSQEFDTEFLQDKGLTMTPNGSKFKIDKQGFLPAMMQQLYDDRTTYKKKMLHAKQQFEDTKNPEYLNDVSRYNNIQMARKISLNSAYGAIGNEWFRYYDLAIAEGVTTAGQLSIRWIEQKLNLYLNELLKTEDEDYVIASDTDSVYICFDNLINKVFENSSTDKVVNFLDTIAKEKIEPYIDKCYQELKEYMNAFAQKMQMKREVIADKGIWVAKKRYILNAWDIEGVRYSEPQLKIMGIEAVKSSTPYPCRQKIKEALKVIMQGNEKQINTFIQDFRKEFMQLSPEEIAFPRSVNGLEKWRDPSSIFQKGTPMHCKGALVYNHLLRKQKLISKFPLIQEGEKIKFLNLRKPNPLQSNVISFISKLPKELEISSYIDYDLQFEKAFVEPLMFIVRQIGWDIDRSYGTQATLEDFFG